MIFRLLACLTFISIAVCAQDPESRDVEQLVESMSDKVAEDADFSELSEKLQFYSKNKIDINKAGTEVLEDLKFLSEQQINAILRHRRENGFIHELYELQTIDELNEESLKLLLPYLKLAPAFMAFDSRSSFQKLDGQLLVTYRQVFQKQRGYTSGAGSGYLGSQSYFLTRFKGNFGKYLSIGLCAEKDAGEPFFMKGQRSGFDFLSGNVNYRGEGRLTKLVLGDYSLQFGQGLSMWSGMGFGKSASIMSVTKNTIGLKPYSSTNESMYLRGLAGTLQLKAFELTPFVSYHNLDGTEREEDVSTINLSGLHRTSAELERKGNLKELVLGSNLTYRHNGLKLGAIIYQTSLNKEIVPRNELYKLYDFKGQNRTNAGVYYSYSKRNLYLFGESAHSLSSGWATVNGVIAGLSPKLSLTLMHRYYQKDFHSFYNQAVAEGSQAINETGFYTGIIFSPSRKTQAGLYVDVFKFPWLRYRVDAPSSGSEVLSQISHSFNKKFSILLRFKQETKEENTSTEVSSVYLAEVKRQSGRIETSVKANSWLQLRSRIEYLQYEKESSREEGVLIFQDFIFRPASSRLSGNMRLAMFDTDSFNSRLYAYENDVLYGYSMPAMQNRGLRSYINLHYRFSRVIDLWMRYGMTKFAGLDKIGSGQEEIQGNRKSDIKLQLRYKI